MVEENRVLAARRARERKNYEDFVIVWLDANLDATSAYENGCSELRSVVNRVETFGDADECVDYVTDVKDERVFLIISGAFGDDIVPLIHNLPQVASIYILCRADKYHEKWSKPIRTVRGVFTDLTPLCELLKKDTVSFMNEQLGIWLTGFSTSEQKVYDWQAEAQFLCKEVLNAVFQNDGTKQQLAEVFRTQYSDDLAQLRDIDDFEDTFEAKDAIRWYTRPCFLPKILNKALRVHDVDVLHTMRFFVRTLHEQIMEQHSMLLASDDAPLSLYRGLRLPTDYFQNLGWKLGGKIAFPTFVSASRNREVAEMFAGETTTECVNVILEIEIDKKICRTPFADASVQSHFKDEEEFLFTMGSVFKIIDIHQDEAGFWNVKICHTNITELMKEWKNEFSVNGQNVIIIREGIQVLFGDYDKVYEKCDAFQRYNIYVGARGEWHNKGDGGWYNWSMWGYFVRHGKDRMIVRFTDSVAGMRAIAESLGLEFP